MEESLKRKATKRSPIMRILPTIDEEDKKSWLSIVWEYRQQFQSMASPSIIIAAGGMKLAWAIFESPLTSIDHAVRPQFLIVSWLVGVIFGSIIASTFVQHVTKNAAYCSAGSLLILGGLLSTTFPTAFPALLGSCSLEGCGYGIGLVQALTTGGEVAHKDIRGLVLSFERISMWTGVCLQLIYIHYWYKFEPTTGYLMHPHRLHGIMVIILGMLGSSLALWHRLESPLLLLVQHHDSMASWTIKRFHGIFEQPSTEFQRLRDDYKQTLAHDAGLTCCEVFWQRNAFSLLRVTLLRCVVSLSLSLPFNRAFITLSWNGLHCNMNCVYLLAISGLLGSCAGGLLIDRKGRRKLSMITLLLSGIFIFLAGGIFRHLETYDIPVYSMDLEMAAYFILLHHFLTNLGSSVASTVYAAEAFTYSMKAKCISVMIVCEYSLLMGLVFIAFNLEYTNWVFFFVIGSLSLLFGLLVFLFMPETKVLSLNQCLIEFYKVF